MYKINNLGKLFLAGVAAWLAGNKIRMRVKGNREEIQRLANALVSSKAFQDELRKPGATVDSVMKKLRIKDMTARDFERLTGIPWPF